MSTNFVTDLSEDDCWARLGATQICRLAFLQDDGAPDIRPVNYLAVERLLYVRTAFDAKFRAVATDTRVALEIDGEDDSTYWSVIARGEAKQVTSESELHRIGVERFASWTASPKHFVFGITPHEVTGREFPKHPRRAPAVYAVPLSASAEAEHRTQRGERPFPIPHFGPTNER
ncbi:pyridoxamine 5'-phosphate oxidase family protein [Microbacterium sp. p3-SID338]|uniref:pyridoxamine 5'-phosphate oxidase family protein n=1 Tax=Microbacterium sp. p3-SID338 TaxID=2916214 RepID=UPI0021A2917A|nr:pyridoxamine 5'-phosphate oxidase family protein [Microbacterium sp. p3-SID338]MCT1394657.1 pyridoxamine 5'-phosphate oxidase family protein [Microbacterium sp. p3-SID338]